VLVSVIAIPPEALADTGDQCRSEGLCVDEPRISKPVRLV